MWGRLRPLAVLAAVITVIAGTILALTVLFNGGTDGSVPAHRLAYDQGAMQSSHAIDAAKAAKNSPAGKLPGGVSRSTLDSIASCESGGDPKAVSSDGTYRGKYQFDSGTWASVGGKGDPAAAPEAEQDMRAAMLYKRTGPTAWPVCG